MANRLLLLGSALVTSALLAAGLVAPRQASPGGPEPPAPPPVIVAEVPRPQAAAPLLPSHSHSHSPSPSPAPRVSRDERPARTLAEQRRALFRTMGEELDLTAEQLEAVEGLIEGTLFVGQGNPAVTRYGMTRAECRAIREGAGLRAEPRPVPPLPCARRNMVPVYDPEAGESAETARLCIDQFEFPDVPCEYPVVYASAREAAQLCTATGKRLCDAHEWEGACAGALHSPEVEYAFGEPRPYATWLHNKSRDVRWAYGPHKNHPVCATNTPKTPGCPGGGWSQCGSNTYPAGAFPACVSPFGVYDQHGNAAEHMNLPLAPSELGSQGGTGSTEMKGSWFVFQREEAHEDDCRWRAKDWHPSRLMAAESHRNYHLGFRCCADVASGEEAPRAPGGADAGASSPAP